MRIKFVAGIDASRAIDDALAAANRRFDGNIVLKRGDQQSASEWQVTLTVVSSRRPGAVVKPVLCPKGNGKGWRRVSAACYHAYGRFMEALPSGTTVYSKPPYLNVPPRTIIIGLDQVWQDFNVGSQLYPLMASEACQCEIEWGEDD